MEDEKKVNIKKEVEALKASIAELGFLVEETEEGEIRVSENDDE